MQTMKNPAIIGLLIVGFAGAVLASDGQETPISLEAAREHGRAESRFLKESTMNEATARHPPTLFRLRTSPAFRESVEPVLQKSCLACHGPEKSEGRLRIDQLNPDLLTGPDVERWREVFGAISKSEMPPEDAADYALADADRGKIVDWLSEELQDSVARPSQQPRAFIISPADELRIQLRSAGPAGSALRSREQAAAGDRI